VPAPHLAAETLHAQWLAPFGVRREFARAAQEVAVFSELDRHAGRVGRLLQRGAHAEFTRLGEHDAPHAAFAQHLREVAHRRQEDHQPLLAAPDVRGLLGGLGHPDAVDAGVETVEGAAVAVDLAAEHDDELAGGLGVGQGGLFGWDLRWRQASEQ